MSDTILPPLLHYQALSDGEKRAVLARPTAAKDAERRALVASIMADVKAEGDAAVRAYSARFDRVDPNYVMQVSAAELAAAEASIDPSLEAALQLACRNIAAFHAKERPADVEYSPLEGVLLARRFRPLKRVGLYVPAGGAPLPSTALMLLAPAAMAGVKERVVVTPPRADGSVNPVILRAAAIAGATAIYKIGGAQAIAALAYGTASIARVDKIFGPGNAFVTLAKSLAAEDGVAIDLPAGPSEVLVIADARANPEFVAADLLAQAEHDADAQVLLVATCPELVAKTRKALLRQLEALPRRGVAISSLKASRWLLAEDLDAALAISEDYAPEHLILAVDLPRARQLADQVSNAGAVFVGDWTPESSGDYAAGSNHVLPTAGWARSVGGVGLETFMKPVSFQELNADGVRRLAGAVQTIARAEGLDAHAESMRLRQIMAEQI